MAPLLPGRVSLIGVVCVGLLIAGVGPATGAHDPGEGTAQIPDQLRFADQNSDGTVSRAEVGQSIAAFNVHEPLNGSVPSRARIGQLIAYFNTHQRIRSHGIPVTVRDVVDGETLEVRYENGSSDIVRLLGIDAPATDGPVTPERFDGIPDTSAGRSWLTRWGTYAADRVDDVVNGTAVRLRVTDRSAPRDSAGRLRATVHVNDSYTLNRQLVADGYVRAGAGSNGNPALYRSSESSARSDDIGLWRFEPPDADPADDDGGRLVIQTIEADPPGSDSEHLNDEYLVLKNVGDEALFLTGWSVRDGDGNVYFFPCKFTLLPGDTTTIHSGTPTGSSSDLYWWSDTPVWDNDGETVIVQDYTGRNMTVRTYS